ncbi:MULTISPECIES: nucleoside-diphosphate kinase [Streptomyces]|uniref:Nucleoside-diphosphate kinase n=1 Tax=Streptomyces solicathayae TaxID=3081768 RepID=A0ABZ0M2I3_9ACTN|nr:nucleoside-diphosphate kinase [Streptomyces sp. HUAS YS2]WOX25990.1 nucleoside-diphosphate kinase [Streptomyces sp. HUAS YS2]
MTEHETQTTFVMLKPDAVERGIEAEVLEMFARFGLRPEGRVERRLTVSDVAALDHEDGRHRNPVQFAVNCDYLTRSPVVGWRMTGPGALGVALTVKALVRQRYGDSDLANLMHAAEDAWEADSQIKMFAQGPAPVSAPYADTDPAVHRMAAEVLASPDVPPVAGGVTGDEGFGVILHDDGCQYLDDVIKGLQGGLPGLPFERAAAMAIAVKVRRDLEVFTGTAAEAATALLDLDGQGLPVLLREPRGGAAAAASQTARGTVP